MTECLALPVGMGLMTILMNRTASLSLNGYFVSTPLEFVENRVTGVLYQL